MRVYTDDDLRRVDRTWLGPPNKRLPWVATYRQYVTIIIVVLSLFGFMLYLGLPMTELGWLFVCGASSYFIVRGINEHYRDDVGIIVNFITAYQELSVPRDDDPHYAKTLTMTVQRCAARAPRSVHGLGKTILSQRIWASRIRSIKDRRVK